MRGSSFKYLLKEGMKNLWTNRVMAFTSVGVLTTCLLIVGAAYLLTVNVGSMVKEIEGQSEMSVYLTEYVPPQTQPEPPAEGDAKTEGEPAEASSTAESTPQEKHEWDGVPSKYPTNDERIAAVRAQFESNPNIKSCEFISKQQGLENTKDMLGEAGDLLDGLEDRNYIPDTFVVTLKDISLTEQTKAEIEQNPEVYKVSASLTVSDTLTYIQKTINTLGFAIIAALGVISLVIISNTIRATIFARRKEINIMKYVGATNSFIRIPFVVEGFMLGLISATVAYLVIWGGYSYLIQAFTTDVSAWMNSLFSSIIPFNSIAPNLALFFVITGTALGTIGSVISIRNHARV